eukprot:Skav225975  [mRNA]  locus=scaffold4916:82961:88142:- [translate_table: standard]
MLDRPKRAAVEVSKAEKRNATEQQTMPSWVNSALGSTKERRADLEKPHWALGDGSAEGAAGLLELRTAVAPKDGSGPEPLEGAAAEGMVAKLEAPPRVPHQRGLRDQDADGEPAIVQAANVGDIAAVQHFIRADSEAVRRVDEDGPAAQSVAAGETALHRAAANGHVEVLSALAAAGADVEKASMAGPQMQTAAPASAAHVPTNINRWGPRVPSCTVLPLQCSSPPLPRSEAAAPCSAVGSRRSRGAAPGAACRSGVKGQRRPGGL